MHDPMSVAHTIKRPWGVSMRSWRYYPALLVIWHKDPEIDGDDSCGWAFPRLTDQHWRVIDELVREDMAMPYFSSPAVHDSGVVVNPEYDYRELPPGDCLALVHAAWLVIAWRYERRRLTPKDHLAIANLAACHNDNIRAFLVSPEQKAEDLLREFFGCVFRNYLRFRRPWYRHPRWHVTHWRVQIPLLQTLQRWLWSRCTHCGQGLRWGETPVASDWHSGGPRWFRGEKNIYHSRCHMEKYHHVPALEDVQP